MASATRELKYDHRKYRNLDVVGGSSAYELDWEDRQRELTHAGEARRYREEQRRQEEAARKVRTVTKVKVREAQHVSMFSVLGITAVLLMSVLVLASYINLTVISAETVKLQQQMAQLETENVALTAQYQQMFDMTTVKDVARASGMDKPGASQVYYIDLSGGDSAVVYQQEEPGVWSRVLTAIYDQINTVVEYFK